MEDLKKGQKCTGKVVNVTHFGAFVDIGRKTCFHGQSKCGIVRN